MEEYADSIKHLLDDLEVKFRKLRTSKGRGKKALLKEIKEALGVIREDLDDFQLEITQLMDFQLQKEQDTVYELLDAHYRQLKENYGLAKLGVSEVADRVQETENLTEEQREQATIDHGTVMLKKTKDRAKRIEIMVGQANVLVTDINDEIKEQNQRMMEMEEVVKDSQSTLSRANQLVRFFARSFYKDMFLKVMIVLIAILIIAICIAAVSKDSDRKAPDRGSGGSVTPKPIPGGSGSASAPPAASASSGKVPKTSTALRLSRRLLVSHPDRFEAA